MSGFPGLAALAAVIPFYALGAACSILGSVTEGRQDLLCGPPLESPG